VPKPFPKEFRRDVIAVARQGDQSIAQVAKSFGISESCLQRWLKIADRDDSLTAKTPSAAGSSAGVDLEAENRELRKQAKQLEQENGFCAGRPCLAPGLMEALNPREDESHGGTEEVPRRAA
jgi:transposase-like protein